MAFLPKSPDPAAPKKIAQYFREVIWEQLELENTSYQRLAQISGVSLNTISRFMRGSSDNIRLDTLVTLLSSVGYELKVTERK